jgi:capsular exopolysaccharide synthesis family protein
MISILAAQTTNEETRPTDLLTMPAPHAECIALHPDKYSRLVFLTEPNGLAVERYKMLRSRLCAMSARGGLILITSPSVGDGKTLTSANLACSLAEAGHPTCLVDFDFRAPGFPKSFGYEIPEDDDDVVEVLAGRSTITRAIRQFSNRPLYILGIKDPQQSPAAELSSPLLQSFLTQLRNTFQWVILDMPPIIPMSDVAEMLPFVDGALLVVRSAKTNKALIPPAMEILGTKCWGAVLNDAEINGSAYYSYYGYGKDRKRKR